MRCLHSRMAYLLQFLRAGSPRLRISAIEVARNFLPHVESRITGGGRISHGNTFQKNEEKALNNNRSKNSWRGRAARQIIRGLMAAFAILAVSGIACAQAGRDGQANGSEINFTEIANVTPSVGLTPPVGNSRFLFGRGVGTQGYVCLPKGTGASWTVNGARPEATLFTNLFGQADQIITHFLSPNTHPNRFAPNPLPFGNVTWQSSQDSSKVWAQVQNAVPAGSEPSCPNAGSIACLLLQVIGEEEGPTGGRQLTKTTFIQRLNTFGGSAPETGCSVSGDVGKQTLVPYSADYIFFREDR